jgi:hypothetical protein
MSLATEDTLEVLPSLLDNHQDLQCISDLGNVVLPQVNLVIKLLVEGRALVLSKLARVLFDKSDNILSRRDFVARIVGALCVGDIDFEIRLWVILPQLLNVVQTFFNLKLSDSISANISDFVLVLK